MKVASTLQIVGLESLASRLPSQISGGQQQRVAIARSLVLEPSIMLLDEPLSNLDYKLRLQMRRELLALQRRLGMTFVFVTHDQSEALALSDEIIVLSNGRIEQIGTPAEVYAKPLSYFVADFIGGSNLLKVTAAEPLSDNRARVRLEAGGIFTAAYATGTSPREAAWLSLRAEDLTLAAPADAGAPDTMSGRPISRLFAGDRVEITVQLDAEGGGSPILVAFYARPEEAIGERVTVRAAPGTPVLVAGGP
jgi:iron(III) transport system ATP-binding protein